MVKLLVDNGTDVNRPPAKFWGSAALQVVAKKGSIKLADFLLAKGANVNQEAVYNAGETALQLAAIKGFIGTVRKLLEVGAVVDGQGSPFFGRIAIEGAAEWGSTDTLYLLLKVGSPSTGPNRRQHIKAIKLADQRGHVPVRFLKSWIIWTGLDAECYSGEVFDAEKRVEKIRSPEKNLDEYENWGGVGGLGGLGFGRRRPLRKPSCRT